MREQLVDALGSQSDMAGSSEMADSIDQRLHFVEDVSYEFVSGGSAVNGY